VAEKGPDLSAEYLRQLADEIDQLAEDEGRPAKGTCGYSRDLTN
jgi:hypothetical protein